MVKYIYGVRGLCCLVFLVSSVFIVGCSNDDKFRLGEDLVDVKSNLALVDTFTLEMSTIKFDSLQTSEENELLAGKFSDGDFGNMDAMGFTRVTPESYTLTIDDDAIYDSICFVARPTGYSYGDTLQYNSLKIHEVTENLSKNANNGIWYNYEKASYSPKILGQGTFKPKPKRKNRVYIRLEDSFGLTMFDSIRNLSKVFYTEENFVKFFKGIAIVPGDESSCILQYDSIQLNLYYHIEGEQTVVTFKSVNSIYYNYHFSHISSDYGSLPLSALKSQKDRLSSRINDNRAYCQSGAGLMIRVDIPYLNYLKQAGTYLKIMKAQLVLSPVKNTYKTIGLPTSLNLFTTNDLNQVGNQFVNSNSVALEPELYIDDQFNMETSYSFDLTSYINSVFSKTTDNEIPSFLVTIPYASISNNLSRLIIGDSHHETNPSKLKIIYWYTNDSQ